MKIKALKTKIIILLSVKRKEKEIKTKDQERMNG